MHSSPETTELVQIFKQLDKQKKGHLTLQEFTSYLDHQPRKVPLYLINDFFNIIPDSKMTEQIFVSYVMGYRLNLENIAVARFALEKELGKYAAASPPSGANQIRKSSLKFTIASKKNLGNGEKHRLSLSFGHDIKSQSQKFAELQDILGRKPDDIVGIIKFKVTGAHEQIRQGLETILQSAKGILTQMDEELFRIVDLFKFNIKVNGNYVYIIIEVGHVFLTDYVTFLNEFIQSISPEALIQFKASVESNYLKQFLKNDGEKKMEDIEVTLGLNTDNQSLKKMKDIISSKMEFYNKQQQLFSVILLLFQQLNFEASFADSQKLFNHLGIGQGVSGAKMQFSALKDMMLFQTLQGFVPQSKDVIQNIKKFAKGDGQISLNLKNLFLLLDFNVEVQGFFDLF